MNCSPPGSSIHRILQARTLEWVAISLSRGASQPRDQTQVSHIAGRRFTLWAINSDQFLNPVCRPLQLVFFKVKVKSFSRVQLFTTSWTVAHQAPPSMGFSRQEYWSGLPFPSWVHESGKWKWITQSCPTLCDPMDCRPLGSFIHGIFQTRILEWVAISFFRA